MISDGEPSGRGVYLQLASANDAAHSPAPRDQRRMRSHASPRGQDCNGCAHSGHVLRVGLLTHQYYPLTSFGPLDSVVGSEYHSSGRAARPGRQSAREYCSHFLGLGVNDGVQQFVQLRRGNTHYCFLRRNLT